MKQKTSVTLSEDVVAGVRRATRRGESRSEAIDRLLRERLADEAARLAHAAEVERLNRHADALNAEGRDVLAFQEEV